MVCAAAVVLSTQTPALAQSPFDEPIIPAPPSTNLPGAGAPPPGFAPWSELMGVQQRLDADAQRVVAARDAGFAGIAVAPEKRSLTVWWKGTPPAGGAAAIADARRADTVSLVRAPYSEAELAVEANGSSPRAEASPRRHPRWTAVA